jgi:hypothetical protein
MQRPGVVLDVELGGDVLFRSVVRHSSAKNARVEVR